MLVFFNSRSKEADMMWTDVSLKNFGAVIQRVLQGENLERGECYAMFREILLDEQPDLHQGAFLAALTAKGETPQEVAGAWQAIIELDTAQVSIPVDEPLVENCGTGMDRLKTFNVSSAAAVLAAAGGVRIGRHGARGITSPCGTVDLLEAVGIAVDCDVDTVAQSIRECGIGLFNGMSPQVHPRALFRILSRIRFGSILNIAASLASPCRPTHAVRGVYSAELLPPVAEVMQAIGYRRAMVVHGFDAQRGHGMDEISILGETVVHEFQPNGRQDSYTLAPEDLGVQRAAFTDIAASGDLGREVNRFLKVLAGTAPSPCVDIACLNAGALLYVAGKAPDLKSGVAQSRDLVYAGQALTKLCQWVGTQASADKSSIRLFIDHAGRAGLSEEVARCL
jgi:anthranilate phosphoribosyltransferase